ncbi:MAG: hypothetical protein D3903_08625, partial [Candidatus Electrothrix sp. GM3_4]|nr:hypothetical protein [Candidatus Electrothrix sp. GM3_4]
MQKMNVEWVIIRLGDGYITYMKPGKPADSGKLGYFAVNSMGQGHQRSKFSNFRVGTTGSDVGKKSYWWPKFVYFCIVLHPIHTVEVVGIVERIGINN